MDILGLIKNFVCIVEYGSIAAAARAQGRSSPAVSQSLAKLEAHLDIKLLSRTTRSQVLTERGQRYYQRVRHIPSEIAHAASEMAEESPLQGSLRIATTVAFGRYLLASAVAEFKQRYPQLEIEVLAADRSVDHRRENIDVSIRIEEQLNPQLIAKPIMCCPFVFCASPAYLARAGTPNHPQDLATHACLVFRYPTDGRFLPWRFRQNNQLLNPKLNPSFISDDISILAEIAVNGGGIVRLASFIADRLIAEGKLVALFTSVSEDDAALEAVPMNLYACVTERAALTKKVRAFIDFIAARLA